MKSILLLMSDFQSRCDDLYLHVLLGKGRHISRKRMRNARPDKLKPIVLQVARNSELSKEVP